MLSAMRTALMLKFAHPLSRVQPKIRHWGAVAQAWLSSADTRSRAQRLLCVLLAGFVVIISAWIGFYAYALFTAIGFEDRTQDWRTQLFSWLPWARFGAGAAYGVWMVALPNALFLHRSWWWGRMFVMAVAMGWLSLELAPFYEALLSTSKLVLTPFLRVVFG
jgi:hypothetical protein